MLYGPITANSYANSCNRFRRFYGLYRAEPRNKTNVRIPFSAKKTKNEKNLFSELKTKAKTNFGRPLLVDSHQYIPSMHYV